MPCDFEPCDNATSTCRNLSDSFICDCRPGYVKDVEEYCRGDEDADDDDGGGGGADDDGIKKCMWILRSIYP